MIYTLSTLAALVLTPVLLGVLNNRFNILGKMALKKKLIFLIFITIVGTAICRVVSSVNESLYSLAIGILLGTIVFIGGL